MSILHFLSQRSPKSSSSRLRGMGFVFMEYDLSRLCTGVVLAVVAVGVNVSDKVLPGSKDESFRVVTVM